MEFCGEDLPCLFSRLKPLTQLQERHVRGVQDWRLRRQQKPILYNGEVWIGFAADLLKFGFICLVQFADLVPTLPLWCKATPSCVTQLGKSAFLFLKKTERFPWLHLGTTFEASYLSLFMAWIILLDGLHITRYWSIVRIISNNTQMWSSQCYSS